MTVVILEDAAEGIEAGRNFYESREAGIGEYFVESILSDLVVHLCQWVRTFGVCDLDNSTASRMMES